MFSRLNSFIFLLVVLFLSETLSFSEIQKHTLEHDGKLREYLISNSKMDDSSELPLVFVFHGGRGNPKQIARHTQFVSLAKEYGFIVVFPAGIEKRWNDLRDAPHLKNKKKEDDLGFILALLEKLKRDYPVDQKRVYATGISNGGFMSQMLAIKASEHFAAVASVTAQIPEPLDLEKPSEPVGVMLINGTDDPFVPNEGGDIRVSLRPKKRKGQSRGKILSTDQTIQYWLEVNSIDSDPIHQTFEDRSKKDQSTAEKFEWSNPQSGNKVILIKINQGGHTWPGGNQYLPKSIIGPTNQDIDASRIIWEFFSTQSK